MSNENKSIEAQLYDHMDAQIIQAKRSGLMRFYFEICEITGEEHILTLRIQEEGIAPYLACLPLQLLPQLPKLLKDGLLAQVDRAREKIAQLPTDEKS